MKRANGLTFISLFALIASAQAQNANGASVASRVAEFGPMQFMGLGIATLALVAIVREFTSPRRRRI